MPYLLSTFAPGLTDAALEKYKVLVRTLKGPAKAPAEALLKLVTTWITLPESKSLPSPHPSGLLQVVELEEKYKEALYDLIPWPSELKTYAEIFETLTETPTRNMCFHLLWYAHEFNLGREPLSNDKIRR